MYLNIMLQPCLFPEEVESLRFLDMRSDPSKRLLNLISLLHHRLHELIIPSHSIAINAPLLHIGSIISLAITVVGLLVTVNAGEGAGF